MVTFTETHLWISQPNWYLFYKYKKCLSQKQNTCICVDKSSQTNTFTTGFVYSNILCCEYSTCHSCCHHHEFTSWRTHEEWCCYRGSEKTSQLLPLTLSERMSRRLSNDLIWDLRHDLGHNLTESQWFFFVNATWLIPGLSLTWDSRSGSKPSLKSSLKSRLVVNMAPDITRLVSTHSIPN